MPHEVSPDAPRRPADPPPRPDPTAAGRAAVGTVLALGLYLGLRKLAAGTVLAAAPDPGGWWLSPAGLAAVHAAQAVAVGFGALVAAAGRPRGYPLGLAVGALCGGLFLGYDLLAGAPPEDLVLYLQPPLLAVVGLAAGALGAKVWPAAPALPAPPPAGGRLSSLALAAELAETRGRPTAWARVLVAAVAMAAAVGMADRVRVGVQRNSGGLFRVQTLGQGQYLTWQLATLAVLAAGAAAGAGTGAGARHGLLAGGLAGGGVLGLCAKAGGALPPVEYWLAALGLDGLPVTAPAAAAAVVGGVVLAGLVGGWLGGTLFPPLADESQLRRTRGGLD
jgi:hypothetical protein